MSGGSNRLLDDLAKLVTDAAGAAQGVRQEAETAVRSQAEKFINKLDLVPREDFEAVKAMVTKMVGENEALKKRVDALEKSLGEKKPSKA